jgi:glycosyltransferase involved in cell wall biosynthesis
MNLSVLIPTRNRQYYLINTINEIIKRYEGLEIVIIDNSDHPLSEYNIKYLNVKNIKYNYSSEILSVIDNFEFALKFATRDYVTIIGDDDLLGPGIESVLIEMEANNWRAIYPWRAGYVGFFFWPGVESKVGHYFISNFTGRIVRVAGNEAINSAFRYPGKGPSDLPKIYQGIVSMELVREVVKKYGKLFGGVSPDIFSGILLASCCKEFYRIDCPLIIPGGSSSSTAGEGRIKQDRAIQKETKEHISRFGNKLIWPEIIPDVYTPHTVWALSLLKAANVIGYPEYKINIGFLYLEMLFKYPKYWRSIVNSMKCYKKNKHHLFLIINNSICSFFSYYFPRILKIFFKRRFYQYEFTDIDNIFDLTNVHKIK